MRKEFLEEFPYGDSCATSTLDNGYSIKCGTQDPIAIHNGADGASCEAKKSKNGLLIKCGKSDEIELLHGDTCATTPINNGYSIQCGKQDPVEIHNGAHGTSCKTTPTDKGLAVQCGDQQPIEITNGTNGNKLQCPDSPEVIIANGRNGTSCMATQTVEGTEIACGTSVSLIKHGKEGPAGESCEVKEAEQKLIFSCTNGTKLELQVVDGKIVTTLPVNKPFTFDPATIKTFHAMLDLYPDAAKAPLYSNLSSTYADGSALLAFKTESLLSDSFAYTLDGGRTHENWSFDFKFKLAGLNEANKKAFVIKDQCVYMVDLTKPTRRTLGSGDLEQAFCAVAPQEIGVVRMLEGSDYLGVSFYASPDNFLLYNVRTKAATPIKVLNPDDGLPIVGLYLWGGTDRNGEKYFIVANSAAKNLAWIKVDSSGSQVTSHRFAESVAGKPAFLGEHLYIRMEGLNVLAHYRMASGSMEFVDFLDDDQLDIFPEVKGTYRGLLALGTGSSGSRILFNPLTKAKINLPTAMSVTIEPTGDYLRKFDRSVTVSGVHSFLQVSKDGQFTEIKPYFAQDDFARMIWMDYTIDPATRTLKSMEILHLRDLDEGSTNRRSFVYSQGQRTKAHLLPFSTYSFIAPAYIRSDVKVSSFDTVIDVDFMRSKQGISVSGRLTSRIVEGTGTLYFMTENTLQKVNRDLESVKNISPVSTGEFRGVAAFAEQVFLWVDSGLYVSKDAGNNFTTLPAPELSKAEKYQFDFDGDTLVAATPFVAAISIDKGRHWNRIDLPENTKVESLRIQKSYLFLNFFSAGKPMISTDFGKTWIPWTQGSTDSGFLTKDLLCFSNFSCAILN